MLTTVISAASSRCEPGWGSGSLLNAFRRTSLPNNKKTPNASQSMRRQSAAFLMMILPMLLNSGRIKLRKTNRTEPMKKNIKKHTQLNCLLKATGILAILGFTLAASSCSSNGVGTHEMGPTGKSHSMADEKMPSKAR